MGLVIHGALRCTILLAADLDGLSLAVPILNKALVRVAGSFLDAALKHVAMLDVFDLLVTTRCDTRVLSLLLILVADSSSNIPDVTVLIILKARAHHSTSLFLALNLVLLLLQCLLNELVLKDASFHLAICMSDLC